MTPCRPKTYSLDLRVPDKGIRHGHLKLGGCNPSGDEIAVNSYYITRNGRPWVVISGEFQPTRYPSACWEQELLKVKAGGVNTVAFYIFWIHHQEAQGRFDWGGNKDIRRFVELIARHGLFAIARVGPFVHGECRNGGLPDWLYGQPWEVRSNHPSYLQKVQQFYGQVGSQLRGLFYRDGGPIIGLQIENEYEHCGAPWDAADRSGPMESVPSGHDGVEHIRRLRGLAEEAGMHAPLLTLTGWDSPILEGESLPMQGGYAYPSWTQEPAPSPLYLFRDFHAQPTIGQRARYVPLDYPAANAELQGGMQVRAHSRVVVPPASTEAMALVRMGGGSNLLGYYVYHGGSNPRLGLGFPNESGHPQVSYDFQAPLGEFGEVRDACRYLKILHLFIESFGENLAPMGVVLPEGSQDLRPADTQTLRWCARARDGKGFVFLNNFQDHLQMPAQQGFRLDLQLATETISIPARGTMTLPPDVCCLLPFNLSMGGAILKQATVQPLTVVQTAVERHYFFFAPQGLPAQYCFSTETLADLAGDRSEVEEADGQRIFEVSPGIEQSFTFQAAGGTRVRVTTLTRQQAEHVGRGKGPDGDCLVISPADVTFAQGRIRLASTGASQIEAWIYPALKAPPQLSGGELASRAVTGWSHLRLSQGEAKPSLHAEDCGRGKWLLTFAPDMLGAEDDAFLTIDYVGDACAAFIDGRLVADHFSNGAPWVIGLKRFWPQVSRSGMVLKFQPLRKGALKNLSSAMAGRVAFEGEELLEVRGVNLQREYRWELAAPAALAGHP